MAEEILNLNNIHKSERGKDYYERTQAEFKIILRILEIWRKEQHMTPENQLILQTFI